ncbi:hypothetical protein D3C72_1619580 [compost metagenome]
MARPTMPALITGPKAALERPQSWISEGAMKPMTATSKPSNSTTKKHRLMMSHWYPATGRLSIHALMSTVS